MVVPCSSWRQEENDRRKANGQFGMTVANDYAPFIKEIEKEFHLTPWMRIMDQAGKGMNADERRNFFDAYLDEDLHHYEAKKNFEYAGYDLIVEALRPRPYIVGNDTLMRTRLRIVRGMGSNDELAYQLRTLRYREWKGNVTDKDAPEEPEQKRRHLVDCLSYLLLHEPCFVEPHTRLSKPQILYPSLAY